MHRPTWNETFIEICKTVSLRSTCAKIQVAAIIVKNKNIISIGYNGTPTGRQHCQDYWKEQGIDTSAPEFKDLHRDWSRCKEVHAEINAILKCKTDLTGAVLYTTYFPCVDCAKCIVSSGIREVVYLTQNSRHFNQVKELFDDNFIKFNG